MSKRDETANSDGSSEGMLNDVKTFHTSFLEVFKLRVGFWEKMVVLNAGTLALSFTGAATFQSHRVGDGGIGFFFAAWKLLITTIVLCLTAQWLEGYNAYYSNRLVIAIHWKYRNIRLPKISIETDASDEHKAYAATIQYAEKLADAIVMTLDVLSFVLGIAVQITTLLAFIWLYRFARINIERW